MVVSSLTILGSLNFQVDLEFMEVLTFR